VREAHPSFVRGLPSVGGSPFPPSRLFVLGSSLVVFNRKDFSLKSSPSFSTPDALHFSYSLAATNHRNRNHLSLLIVPERVLVRQYFFPPPSLCITAVRFRVQTRASTSFRRDSSLGIETSEASHPLWSKPPSPLSSFWAPTLFLLAALWPSLLVLMLHALRTLIPWALSHPC